MLSFDETKQTIEQLLESGSEASIVYAALECRLAIERICYDRFQRYSDLVSADDLKNWQPKHIIQFLVDEIDPHVATNVELNMRPSADGDETSGNEKDWIKLGSEKGIDHRTLHKLWHGISREALHTKLLTGTVSYQKHQINRNVVESQINQMIAVLEDLSKSTMSMSFPIETIRLTCKCGYENKFTKNQIENLSFLDCKNSSCELTYKASSDNGKIAFELLKLDFECDCGHKFFVSAKSFRVLDKDSDIRVTCRKCDKSRNYRWVIAEIMGGD